MKIRKAVIPAAGFGTRMLPVTKAVPKEMLPILNKPCIQYIVEEAVASGIEEILLITGRTKKAIEDHFDRSPELELHLVQNHNDTALSEMQAIADLVDIHYVRQKTPLGLGHAVLCAKSFVGDEPFAVLLGDDIIQSATPVTKQLLSVYSQPTRVLLGVQPIPLSDISKYGIVQSSQLNATGHVEQQMIEGPCIGHEHGISEGQCIGHEHGNSESQCIGGSGVVFRVDSVIEKPAPSAAPSNVAVLGRYILPPDIFSVLEQTPVGHGGELQLTDAIQHFALAGRADGIVFEGMRHDIGNLEGWLGANIAFALDDTTLGQSIVARIKRDPRWGVGL